MNFEIKNSKQLKNNIIDISAINISDIICCKCFLFIKRYKKDR